jgi:hypothetical protein
MASTNPLPSPDLTIIQCIPASVDLNTSPLEIPANRKPSGVMVHADTKYGEISKLRVVHVAPSLVDRNMPVLPLAKIVPCESTMPGSETLLVESDTVQVSPSSLET